MKKEASRRTEKRRRAPSQRGYSQPGPRFHF